MHIIFYNRIVAGIQVNWLAIIIGYYPWKHLKTCGFCSLSYPDVSVLSADGIFGHHRGESFLIISEGMEVNSFA